MKLPLIFCFMVIGMVPLTIQGITLITSLRLNMVDTRMAEMQNQGLILANKMASNGYLMEAPESMSLNSRMDVVAEVFNGRIVVIDKNFKIIRDTFEISKGKINVSEEILKCFQGESSSKYNKDRHYFAIILPIHGKGEKKEVEGVMLMTASTENLLMQAEKIGEKIDFLTLLSLWLLLMVTIILSFFLVRPFKRLHRVLNRVSEGNSEEDIVVSTYKETRQISDTVGSTLAKLKEIDQSRQEFVSNVSHELKTPITSIRVLADTLMSMEEVPPELYHEFMTDISDEIDRESKIIDDLLTLVRADKSSPDINITSVSINGLLELILKRLRPIAKKRNIEVIFESIREVTADVDEVKLSLALTNLVENAIKYNLEEGLVRVVLDADHKFFYVRVIDNGVGIAEEFQNKIFERFYRIDKARSRETGGTGLGLSITKSVIMMHHGALKLQSKEGEGTTFTVRIPLTYIP